MQSGRSHDKQEPVIGPAPLKRRLFWFLACFMLGLAIGLVGKHLTADPRWLLAVPAMLALGWLFFTNPEACLTGCRKDDAP
ncbi:DUF2157 domain-containing protein [Betaproteobacteria bacterium SCN2]|jgi:hypothetical protein|nr:DUF2157 domain-containing protein [Betaproteobacteria bacterium SCN2]